MKLLFSLLAILALGTSAFSKENEPAWLTQYYSVETAIGIIGLPGGTMVIHIKNDMYNIGKDMVVDIPKKFITTDAALAAAIAAGDEVAQATIKNRLAAEEAIAKAKADAEKAALEKKDGKAVQAAPVVSASTNKLGVASLQTAGALGGSGANGSGSVGGTHSRMSRGFYVNNDGSLGKRVGEK